MSGRKLRYKNLTDILGFVPRLDQIKARVACFRRLSEKSGCGFHSTPVQSGGEGDLVRAIRTVTRPTATIDLHMFNPSIHVLIGNLLILYGIASGVIMNMIMASGGIVHMISARGA